MKIILYSIRFLLALLFIYSGIEKLFLPFNAEVFKENTIGSDPLFFQFYNLLQTTGYLYFVGFFQLLCGVLLVFKRTYTLASIMLVPLLLSIIMTHVYFSKVTFNIIFDSILFILNAVLIAYQFKDIKMAILKPQQRWI